MAEADASESFATFLQTIKRRRNEADLSVPVGALLALLAARHAPMSIHDIQPTLGIGLLDLAETLRSLSESGLVSLSGDPGEEAASLTARGEALTREYSA